MKFSFLGTGTSQGVPVIACPCPVCHSSDTKDKRLRTSGLLQTEQTSLVFDTGPDFRQQMLRHQVLQLDAVVFTHEHKDHVAGLDDVRSYNFLQKRDMPIFATEAVQDRLKQEFSYAFDPKEYPGVPQLQLNTVQPGQAFMVGDIELLPIPVRHRDLEVMGYRVENFAYVTDTNYISEASQSLLKGLDILVLDALRIEPHHSHFTLSEALDMIEILQARKAYLIHISHLMGKHREISRTLPSHVQLAYDGLEVELEG
ncbi:MAG: MBL fold metallo-hydrolase [Bacteroidota bacterium]